MKQPTHLVRWPEVSSTWDQMSKDNASASEAVLELSKLPGNPSGEDDHESVTVVLADYGNPSHAAALDEVLSNYAEDIMGGGEPLYPQVRRSLVKEKGNKGSFFATW